MVEHQAKQARWRATRQVGQFEPPKDLFIPPDALEIFLQEFSGPLDLLLYLIRKRNMDIQVINIAEVANQYLEYIRLMKEFKLHLAADYLVMAAILAEIKSRALLAQDTEDEDTGEVSAELLIAKIKAYQLIQEAAAGLDDRARVDRDLFVPYLRVLVTKPATAAKVEMDANRLARAFLDVVTRRKMRRRYEIRLAELSTRERMTGILHKLRLARELNIQDVPFTQFWTVKEGMAGAVVTFVALMQLIKEGLVDIRQEESYAPIYVRAGENSEDA